MYWAYKSYLFFINKVWPFPVKMLFWTSVCLCRRAAIQLRNDAFCLNLACEQASLFFRKQRAYSQASLN